MTNDTVPQVGKENDVLDDTSVLRVLLVEDNKHDTIAAVRALKKAVPACDVTTCVRAEEANEIIEASELPFDLVMSDLHLPGLHGLEFCTNLAREKPDQAIVILTGSGSEETAVRALKAGVSDYIIKDPDGFYTQMLPVVIPQVVRQSRERSERKRLEQALHKSEDANRAIIETSKDWIWAIDAKGIITYSNPAIQSILGYKENEIIGKPCLDFIHENDKEMMKENFVSPDKRQQGWNNLVIQWRHKDGSYRILESNAVPSINEKNEYSGFRGVDRDITERKQAEEELKKLSRAVEASSSAVIITDPEGIIEYINPRFSEITGYTKEEVLGQIPRTLLQSEEIPSVYDDIAEGIKSNGKWEGEFYSRKKDGSRFWDHASISSVKNTKGEITHFIGVQDDVTERRHAEEELKKLSRAVQASSSAVIITDPEGVIDYVNPKFSEITGYTSKEVNGKQVNILKSEETPISVYDDLWKTIISGKEWKGEFRNRKKDGSLYWASNSISCVKNANGDTTHYVALHDDITDSKDMEEKLKYMVAHDSLTGLLNRNEMMLRLNNEIERASRYERSLSIFMLDLDYFKSINDTYGHHSGDITLKNLASILESSIRNTDYAARYGGEEFVVILPEAPLAKAEELAERLRKQIEETPFPLENGKDLRMTTSIGVATFPEHAQSVQDLLKIADLAMYAAKRSGRNMVKSP